MAKIIAKLAAALIIAGTIYCAAGSMAAIGDGVVGCADAISARAVAASTVEGTR